MTDRYSRSSGSSDSTDVGLRRRNGRSYDDLAYDVELRGRPDNSTYDDDEADEMEQLLVRYWGNRPLASGPWKADIQSETCHRCGKKVDAFPTS